MIFLVAVVLAWGLTWPVNKLLLESLPPLWLMALRSAIATAVLFAVAVARGRLAAPPRADLPVLLSITLLHIVGFGLLAAWGLRLVPTGRSVVLAYTTPLWVIPGARLFLGERLTLRQLGGVAVGLLGLAVLFNPLAFDWTDRDALLGNCAIVLAAFLWAASILHIRGHAWQSTPFDLVPWEMLLATTLFTPLALATGPPSGPAASSRCCSSRRSPAPPWRTGRRRWPAGTCRRSSRRWGCWRPRSLASSWRPCGSARR